MFMRTKTHRAALADLQELHDRIVADYAACLSEARDEVKEERRRRAAKEAQIDRALAKLRGRVATPGIGAELVSKTYSFDIEVPAEVLHRLPDGELAWLVAESALRKLSPQLAKAMQERPDDLASRQADYMKEHGFDLQGGI